MGWSTFDPGCCCEGGSDDCENCSTGSTPLQLKATVSGVTGSMFERDFATKTDPADYPWGTGDYFDLAIDFNKEQVIDVGAGSCNYIGAWYGDFYALPFTNYQGCQIRIGITVGPVGTSPVVGTSDDIVLTVSFIYNNQIDEIGVVTFAKVIYSGIGDGLPDCESLFPVTLDGSDSLGISQSVTQQGYGNFVDCPDAEQATIVVDLP